MKIWTYLKTGETYPDRGGEFTYWPDYKPKANKMYVFLYGIGWKYYPSKDWESKEIPDLPFKSDVSLLQKHPDSFRTYAKEYGRGIAMAQLPCADFCKPSWTDCLLDPNYPCDSDQKWFYDTFNPKDIGSDMMPEFMKVSVWNFMMSIGMVFGKFYFDIVKFDNYMEKEFGYENKNNNQSLSDFVKEKFGNENHERFVKLFLTSTKK